MDETSLAELVRPAGRRAGSDINLPVYSVTKHAGFVPSLDYFKKQVFSRDLQGYKVVDPGDFAYATIHLDEGSIGIASSRALISPMYTVFSVDQSRVDPAFLLRYLKSSRALEAYSRLGRGAVHRRKAISLVALGSLRVPLPPLGEQRHIAAILENADLLRGKRRQVLTHLDNLASTHFFETFRSVQRKSSLKDVGVDFVSGKNVLAPNLDSHATNRVIKVSAISRGTFVATESKPMPASYMPPESHRLHRGDILFGRASGSQELLGATAVVDSEPEDLFLPDKVWRLAVRPGAPVLPQYILGVLRSAEARAFIRHNASGATGVRNIGKARLLEHAVPVPPISLQQEYLKRIQVIDLQRVAVSSGLHLLDELFVALQSRAFREQL